jgi:hypothetical protein
VALAQAVALQLDAMGTMNDAVEDCVAESWIAEHLEMPQRLTGESLRSGSLIRIIPCVASVIRSVIDTLGEDRR